jgi:prepilin-type N-terminal cleavage/methylation domain-containing protein
MQMDSIGNLPTPEMRPGNRAPGGFTLIELLVVIGITAMLAAVLLPALANAGAQDQAVQCMNNCKQLANAWTTYAADNNDKCVNNYGVAAIDYDIEQNKYNTWCVDVMDWTTSSQNTNISLMQKALLGPYIGTSTSSYKCPADNYLSSAQVSAGFQARIRSYAMNDFLGLFSDCNICGDGGPGSGPDWTYQSKNQFNTTWPQYLTLASIPQPANIFVFLDEHPCSINDGYFDDGNQAPPANPTTWEGSDLPASYHNGAGGFAFSDAHAEIHKWLNYGTVVPVVPGTLINGNSPGGPTVGTPANYVERIWLYGHACVN